MFYKVAFYDKSESKYEKLIMNAYFDFLKAMSDYDKVAFLIPELRFKKEIRHKYRLDFTVLSTNVQKRNIGFELSPHSTHAYTQNIAEKKTIEIIKEEIQRWEKEIGKRNEYYEAFGIHVKTFMERELQDIEKCFEIIKGYLYYDDDKKDSWKMFKRKIFT